MPRSAWEFGTGLRDCIGGGQICAEHQADSAYLEGNPTKNWIHLNPRYRQYPSLPLPKAGEGVNGEGEVVDGIDSGFSSNARVEFGTGGPGIEPAPGTPATHPISSEGAELQS